MSTTRLPGIKAIHAIITDNCRTLRTDEGAIDEALARIRAEALSCMGAPGNAKPDVRYHLILTVERALQPSTPEAKPMPVGPVAPVGEHLTTDPDDPALTRGVDTEPTEQAEKYLVLSEMERAKGFVRPVRNTYRHATCGQRTNMGRALAETYARDPSFYGGTYCATCKMHKPVGEFTWEDGSVVGS